MALDALCGFLAPPAVRALAETAEHGEILREILRRTPVGGILMHDAHPVTLAPEHGLKLILAPEDDRWRFARCEAVTVSADACGVRS